MRLVQAGFVATLAAMLWSAAAVSQVAPETRVAIQGYDPVAFFTEGRPMKGSSEIHQDFDGQRYQFANAQHKAAFVADPDRYVPQFGANCAGLLIKDKVRPGNPLHWIIVEDQLFLFAGAKGAPYIAKHPGALAKARQNWEARKK